MSIVVCWEYQDGSGGDATAADAEEAYQMARRFAGEPVRVWIGDEQVQRGFVAWDERHEA